MMAAALLVLACSARPAGSSEVPPHAVNIVQPAYPEAARRAGTEGTAIVEVTVGTDGVMRACRVATSSGDSLLDEAALQAVHVSTFAAGTIDGKPAEMKVMVPFRFKLADKQSEQMGERDFRGVARRYEPAVPSMEV